jgi:hypothetical protein
VAVLAIQAEAVLAIQVEVVQANLVVHQAKHLYVG